MTRERELLQQALDALTNCLSEHGHRCNRCDSEIDEGGKLIAALREALAAPQAEPVAWYLPSPDGDDSIFRDHRTVVACTGNKWEGFLPLYAAPPAAPEPEPVAEVYRARYGRRARNVGVNDVRKLNGVALPPLGTKLYAAPPAAPDHLRDVAEKAAPAAPVPDGWVMVPRGLLRRLIAEALTFDPSLQDKEAIEQAKQLAASPATPAPINMVLHCPKCGLQHIDAPDHPHYGGMTDATGFHPRWDNPPHRSHLCKGCGNIWRPADVPTNGVAAVATKGKADSPIAAPVVPLTDSELAKIAVEDEFLLYCDQDSFNEIARAIEAAHGITGGKT